MNKNKGFTLIELLAVIVILAVIAVISVPLITGVIEKAQASAYKESLRGIFGATDLYIASANFNGFPNDGINITDSNIQMKNKSFTSGKIIKNAEGKLELEKVSNGSYCGSGPIDNLVIIEGSCDSLDETAPTDVTLTSNLVASNSVTIVASATDDESGISGYQFSKDNGVTWTNKQTSNVYTFTGLINNTSYTFKVKVYNNNLLSTISSEVTETTTNVEVPTYTINPTGWTKSAVVTIRYPERESGYVYEYSLDEGLSWTEVARLDVTKDITFNENGSVIAKISDGVNEIVGTTYQVANIDNNVPVITVDPMTITIMQGNTYTDSGVTANDVESGDLTASVIKNGSVDSNAVGTYLLTYNVSDEAGNAAIEVTRTVEVIYRLGTQQNPGISCKDILDNNGSIGSGNYWVGNPAVEVYCDMTSFGGGWTQLNGTLAPVSSVSKGSASWSGNTLTVGIVETGCGTSVRQYNLTSPSFDYTEAFVLFQRVNTLGQCSAIGSIVESGWFNGPTFTGTFNAYGMCNWGDNVWAYSCCNAQNTSGLKTYWVMKSSGSSRFSLYYDTQCASGSGTGYHKWFVR